MTGYVKEFGLKITMYLRTTMNLSDPYTLTSEMQGLQANSVITCSFTQGLRLNLGHCECQKSSVLTGFHSQSNVPIYFTFREVTHIPWHECRGQRKTYRH